MKIETILKNAIYAGIFAIPFVPLIVSNAHYFPFITGKAFFFRIIVEIIAALWLILAFRDKRFMPQYSWITIALTVFAGVILVADLFSANVTKSLWSNFERMEGWVTIAHLWIFYLVASSTLQATKLWNRLFNTSIGVSVILILYAFAQLAGKAEIHQGNTRLDASLGNAAYFAVYLLVHFFITLFMLYRNWGNVALRYVYGIIAILQLVILYFTGTRGSVLGLLGGLIIGAGILLIARRDNKSVRNGSVGLLVALVVLIGGFQFVKDSQFVQQSEMLSRLAAINIRDAAPRLAIWNMALEGFIEKPILGWGQESFNYVFNKYYKPSMYDQEQWFDRAHNVFFDWLIAAGIIGLASYLSLFAVALWYIWKKKSDGFDFYEKVIFTSMLAAYFIHNLFVFDHLVSYILFMLMLSYIHAHGTEREFAFLGKWSGEKVSLYATPAIVIIFFVAFYYVNVIPMSASKNLIYALTPQGQAGPAKNLEYFKKALSYDSFADQEIREQLGAAAANFAQTDIDQSIKRDFYDTAKAELEEWITETPNDARAHLYAGSFFARFGQFDLAETHLKKAAELSPTKQTILFELGANYISQNKHKEALEVFKYAFELEPEFEEARLMYAVAAMHAGDAKLAESLLAPLEGNPITMERRLISAYAAVGNYKKIVDIYNNILKNDPKNYQVRVSLAATYLAMGDRTSAIREIQQTIVDNPDFKEQGEYYIREIRAGRNP